MLQEAHDSEGGEVGEMDARRSAGTRSGGAPAAMQTMQEPGHAASCPWEVRPLSRHHVVGELGWGRNSVCRVGHETT